VWGGSSAEAGNGCTWRVSPYNAPMAQLTPDVRPDYHFLLVAPNLEPEWLFRAARLYWETFDLTVISDGVLLSLLPPEPTVAVSVLTRRDAYERMAVEVLGNREDAYLDLLIYDSVREAAIALDARAQSFQPFGVPLRPTEIPPTREIIQPTPGSIIGGGEVPSGPATATPNTSGFVTQVPTPTPGNLGQPPTPSPSTPAPDDNSDDGPSPIQPTPGSVIGG
jgi:hypothetical protein